VFDFFSFLDSISITYLINILYLDSYEQIPYSALDFNKSSNNLDIFILDLLSKCICIIIFKKKIHFIFTWFEPFTNYLP
jgi:hypothetical protein